MKYIKLILLLVLLQFIGVFSCKKPDPVQPTTPVTPVFTLTGTVGGSPVSLKAGVSNYYMATSDSLDANGIYNFIGELKDKSCTGNCTNALKITIKDYRKYATLPTSIDTSIVPAYYSFASPAGTSTKFYVEFFDSLYNGLAKSYTWDFGDGSTLVFHKPIHLYNHPGVYNVSLTTQSKGTCSSSLTNQVVLGQAGGAFPVTFSEQSTTNNDIHFTGNLSGVPPVTFVMDFGDGSSTTGTHWTHTYASPGIYPASFTITDAKGNVGVRRINAATQNATSCYTNYTTNIIPVLNPQNYSDVIIEWRDVNGTLYTSNNNSQPDSSMFKIISVENYDKNENNQPTKKITAKVSCTLYNGTSTIDFTGDIVFSVAYQ